MTRARKILVVSSLCISLAVFMSIIMLLVKLQDIVFSPTPNFLKSESSRTETLIALYFAGCVIMLFSALIAISRGMNPTKPIERGRSTAIAALYCTLLMLVTYGILLVIYAQWSFLIIRHQFHDFEAFLWSALYTEIVVGAIFALAAIRAYRPWTKNWFYYIIRGNAGILALGMLLALFYPPSPPYGEICASSSNKAINALRTLSSAQELYKYRNGYFGDYFNLNDGAHNKYIDMALAKADPDHPQAEPTDGYWVDISVNAKKTDWCAIARPAVWGARVTWWDSDMDTMRNFLITSDGGFYWNAEKDSTKFTRGIGSRR